MFTRQLLRPITPILLNTPQRRKNGCISAPTRYTITAARQRDRERGDVKLLVHLLMLRRGHVDLAAAKRLRDGGWLVGGGAARRLFVVYLSSIRRLFIVTGLPVIEIDRCSALRCYYCGLSLRCYYCGLRDV